MREIRSSPYRQPVTPEGLKKIEDGTLDYFDPEIYTNFNTGVLEQYLEEKNKVDSYKRSKFNLKKVLLMIVLVGLPFIVITQFVVLETGIMIGGSFYLVYIIGLSLKWRSNDINIFSGSVQAAEKTILGFVYTFPAIYILSKKYEIFVGDEFLINTGSFIDIFPVLSIVTMVSITASFLGLTYFTIFRRIWIVEDPLPSPSSDGFVNIMGLSENQEKNDKLGLKKKLRPFYLSLTGITLFAFFRSFPLIFNNRLEMKRSLLGSIFDLFRLQNWFSGSDLHFPGNMAKYFDISLRLSGLYFGIGWFLRSKASSTILMGSLLSSLIIVPLAVLMNVPVELSGHEGIWIGLNELKFSDLGTMKFGASSIAGLAFSRIATPIAIGGIIGSGLAVLVKFFPLFKKSAGELKDTKSLFKRKASKNERSYDMPSSMILPAAIITIISFNICFIFFFPFDPLLTIPFSLLLVVIVFFLGIISSKTAGETGLVPTSILSLLLFTILMVLIQVYNFLRGNDRISEIQLLMAILTTTIFTCTISMSSDILWDFKTGLYVGTKPIHLYKGQTIGMIIGLPFAALSSFFLVEWVFGGSQGSLNFAPQAESFAFWANVFINSGDIRWKLFILGAFIGIIAEFITGRGMAFSLGMFLPMQIPLGIFIGGTARDQWEKRWLKKKAEANNWSKTKVLFKTLDSYMVMIGFVVGEALFGVLIAIYYILI